LPTSISPRKTRTLPTPVELPAFAREVQYDRVSFSYDAAPVLRNIEFTALKGEVVAFVRHQRRGQDDARQFASAFLRRTSGAVRIDGLDIREAKLRSLRGQIAMVTQENILFHDTVGTTFAMD